MKKNSNKQKRETAHYNEHMSEFFRLIDNVNTHLEHKRKQQAKEAYKDLRKHHHALRRCPHFTKKEKAHFDVERKKIEQALKKTIPLNTIIKLQQFFLVPFIVLFIIAAITLTIDPSIIGFSVYQDTFTISADINTTENSSVILNIHNSVDVLTSVYADGTVEKGEYAILLEANGKNYTIARNETQKSIPITGHVVAEKESIGINNNSQVNFPDINNSVLPNATVEENSTSTNHSVLINETEKGNNSMSINRTIELPVRNNSEESLLINETFQQNQTINSTLPSNHSIEEPVSNVSNNSVSNFTNNETIIFPVINVSQNITEYNLTQRNNNSGNQTTAKKIEQVLDRVCFETCSMHELLSETVTLHVVTSGTRIVIDDVVFSGKKQANITVTEREMYEEVRINEPVQWKKIIKGDKKLSNISVSLPATAKNISVMKGKYVKLPIVENTIVSQPKEASAGVQGQQNLSVDIREQAKTYEITYTLPGPAAIEEPTAKGKRVTIHSNIHYENIQAYASIKESDREAVHVYHVTDEGRSEVEVSTLDTNNNGLVDRVEWIVPHLSTQVYEIEIVVLNVISYPKAGDEWRVEFETSGVADLIVSSPNATFEELFEDDEETIDELSFLDAGCDSESLLSELEVRYKKNRIKYDHINASVKPAAFIVHNYSCATIGYFSSKVNIPGYATLEFKFGNQTAFAYDPENITSTEGEFDLGTYNNTEYNDTAVMLEYWSDTKQELPDNGTTDEWGVNMTGNVLLLHLNEQSTDSGPESYDVEDFSGRNNVGNITGDVTVNVSGKLNRAFQIDGTGDGIEILNESQFDDNTFTYMAWVNTTSYYDYQAVITKWNNTNGHKTRSLFIMASGVLMYSHSTDGNTGNEFYGRRAVTQGEWHHIVATYDNSTKKLYLDGALDRSQSNSFTHFSSDAQLFISGVGETSDRFTGQMDEIAVFDRALSDEEIRTVYQRQKNKYGGGARGNYTSEIIDSETVSIWSNISWTSEYCYHCELPNEGILERGDFVKPLNMTGNLLLLHMDESSGSLTDSSGQGSTGAASGDPAYEQEGRIRTGIDFDGAGDYFIITNESVYDFERTDSFSLGAWVKTSNTADDDFIIAKEENSGDYRGYYLSYGVNGLAFILQSTGAAYTQINSTANILDGFWHHIVATYEGGSNAAGMRIYVDGKNATGNTVQDSLSTNTILNDVNLTIGSRDSGSVPFNGLMDEVFIFNRTLSAAEIENSYMHGAAKLNLSARTCDDSSCSGESFTQISNNTQPRILELEDNQYFQYFFEFETHDTGFTPKIHNITLNYESATPYINFTHPTKEDNTNTDLNYTEINVSVVDKDLNYLELVWNNTQQEYFNNSNLIIHYNFDNISAIGDNGTEVKDNTKHGYNGSFSDNVHYNYTDVLYGSAVRFNGTGEIITVGDVTQLNGAPAFTLSAWVLQDTLDVQAILFRKKEDKNNDEINVKTTGSGNLQVIIRPDLTNSYGYFDYSPVVNAGEWFYLTVAYNGSGSSNAERLNVYINGQNQTLSYVENIPSATSSDLAGDDFIISDATNAWNGMIDEMRLWNRTLSKKEILEQYTANLQRIDNESWSLFVNKTNLSNVIYEYNATAIDLLDNANTTETRRLSVTYSANVSFNSPPTPSDGVINRTDHFVVSANITESDLQNLTYTFNNTEFDFYSEDLIVMFNFDNVSALDESDDRAIDLSVYNHSNTGTSQINSSGYSGAARDFNATTDYLEVSDESDFDFVNELTIAGWINTRNPATGNQYVFDKQNRYSLAVHSSGKLGFYYSTAAAWTLGTTVLQSDTWYHVAVTFNNNSGDDREVKLFLNGMHEGARNDTSALATDNNEARVGCYSNGGGSCSDSWGFDGMIDELMVWNRSLSGEEINVTYRSILKQFDTDKWELTVNNTNLTDGTYDYNVTACDSSTCTNTSTQSYTVDTINPIITIVTPAADNSTTVTSASYELNGTCEANHLHFFNVTVTNETSDITDSFVYDNINSSAETSKNITFTTTLTEGVSNVTFTCSDHHTKRNIGKLKKEKKDRDWLEYRDSETDTTVNIVVLPYDEKGRVLSVLYDLESKSELINNEYYKMQWNFSVPKTNMTFKVFISSPEHNIQLPNSEFIGHIVYGDYHIDFERARTINVTRKVRGKDVSQEINTDIWIDRLNASSVVVNIKPTDDFIWEKHDFVIIDPITEANNKVEAVAEVEYNEVTNVAPNLTGVDTAPHIVNKTAPIFGFGNYSDNDGDYENYSTYKWFRNEEVVDSGTLAVLFHARFNGINTTIDGENATEATYEIDSSGKYGGSLFINGTDTEVNLTYSTVGNLNYSIGTVEFWLKPRYNGDDNNTYHYMTAEGNGDELFAVSKIVSAGVNYLSFVIQEDGTTWHRQVISLDNETFTDNVWHYVAATWNETGNLTLFLNDEEGTYAPQSNGTGILTGISDYFVIGNEIVEDSPSPANASFDEFRIHGRVLNATELLENYNKGRGFYNQEIILHTEHYNKSDDLVFEYCPYDGNLSGSCFNSTTVEINNSKPGLTRVTPNDQNYTMLDRSPDFNWTSHDADGDTLQYYINITTGTCSDVYNDRISTANFTPTTDLCVDEVYNWTIQVEDDEINSTWLPTFNFTVPSTIIINMTGNASIFGAFGLGDTDDTTDDDPSPINITNIGNVKVDIGIYSTVGLWSSVALNTSYWQFRADNTSGIVNAIDWGNSLTEWTNVSGDEPTANKTVLSQLSYNESNVAAIEQRVEVPLSEPPGNKTGSLTLVASYSG